MDIFRNRQSLRGLAKEAPSDPHDALVDELRASYPYGDEAFGARAIIHIVVWTILKMRDLGHLQKPDDPA